MSEYVLAYYNGGNEPESPEEGAKGMAKWQAWLVGLGDAVSNPGTPFGPSKIVGPTGISDADEATRLTGFTMVKADGIDAAVEMAKSCPFLDFGTIQVAEVMDMNRSR